MRVVYWIDWSCEPKRQLGIEGLRRRLRELERLSAGSAVTEDEATRALEAGFALRPLAFHCGRCRANHRRREFGCLGALPLPLSARAEEWLMERLPQTLKLETGSPEERRRLAAVRELLRLLRGAGTASDALERRLRSAAPVRLLQRAEPAVRRYGFLLRPERVSSSQLLDLLLCRGELGPLLGETVLRALGVWVDGTSGSDGLLEAVFTQPEEHSDDPSIAALKRLFLALMVASSLDAAVRSAVTE